MGWIRHHGIVVTSWDAAALRHAHAHAAELGMTTTEIVASPVNGYSSFLVAPDGSKEGWDDSNTGDAQREAFVAWLDSRAYSDGSSALSWIEYEHDSDNGTAKILRFTGKEQPTAPAAR